MISSHRDEARVLLSVLGEAVDPANLGFSFDGAREQRVVSHEKLVDGEGRVVGRPVGVVW